MNNTTITTTAAPSNATLTFSLDYYYSLFKNPAVVVYFYRIAFPITFILGFVGNIASLITFSRLTLRRVSTGCLFIALAISDTLFLVACVIDFVEFGLQVSFYRRLHYDELCRFRSFIIRFSQVLSGWTLVTVSIDRWIRTRFPFKSSALCTPKHALLVVGLIVVLDIALYSHFLTSLYGMLIPGFAMVACGPTIYSGSYFSFFFLNWGIVEIIVICLLPVAIMIIILVDIFIILRVRKRAVIQPNVGTGHSQKSQQQRHLQLQMFVLMIASIAIFLITTLPIAIYRITSPRERNVSNSIVRIISVWVGLGWFQSLNYAVNFYVHCLSSNLFRREFTHQIRYLCGDRQFRVTTVDITVTAHRTRTQHHHP